MNEDVNKFKSTIKDITDNLRVLCYLLEVKRSYSESETVSELLCVYEDTADRLKKAFDTLREEIGNKKINDL